MWVHVDTFSISVGRRPGASKSWRPVPCAAGGKRQLVEHKATQADMAELGHGWYGPSTAPTSHEIINELQTQENADFHGISCRNRKRIRLGVQIGFWVEISKEGAQFRSRDRKAKEGVGESRGEGDREQKKGQRSGEGPCWIHSTRN